MLNVLQQRLGNQRLAGNPLPSAAAVVAHFGAAQAQDYANAKWALGLRMQEATDAIMDDAFNRGEILRLHVMRPTWHFVTPADIRWLVELTAPRVNVANAYMYRKLGLDDILFRRSNKAIAEALAGGRYLTRPELAAVLARAGIRASGMRLGYILHRAELDAIMCSGPRRGKQFTYAILDERAPQARSLPYDLALAELARCYFTAHGPASVADFAWWSGLTKKQATAGLDKVRSLLVQEKVGDRIYWWAPEMSTLPAKTPAVHLLPNYDEYLLSYREPTHFLDRAYVPLIKTGSNPQYGHFLVIDGRVAGVWRRDFEKETVVVTLKRFRVLKQDEEAAVQAAVDRYGRFYGQSVVLQSAVDGD
jgi:hypothetical protein